METTSSLQSTKRKLLECAREAVEEPPKSGPGRFCCKSRLLLTGGRSFR